MKPFPPLASRSLIAIGTLGLLGGAHAASLVLTSVTNPGKYLATPGDWTGIGVSDPLGSYAGSSALVGSSIWTFCLEKTEYFTSGNTYNVAISGSDAVAPGGDVISVGTASLYELFVNGTLASQVSGFQYDAVWGARLQKTIWALEDEGSETIDSNFSSYLSGFADSKANYTGGDVKVLNLTTLSGGNAQDQLFYQRSSSPTPRVPDAGSSLLLLGLSLGGMRLFYRSAKA